TDSLNRDPAQRTSSPLAERTKKSFKRPKTHIEFATPN
ncbi:MAG: hypothetical protein ACI814_003291, partial [Mariniblastus sp.]